MSKPKGRLGINKEICADCSLPDPSWASVNRGVFMCNECAGVHRSLGRHVSQVKHLHKSDWHPNQFNMVQQLASVGANSIWEHALLDPAQMRSGKRKPNPADSVHPTKSEFIRAKYEQLAFVHRPPRRDDEDLGKQLHSSVRTANLDTSLRLLSLGAQAHFFHSEKGNTPLHVAAKAGQALQVELLVTYGADPAGMDVNKHTPEALARAEGHNELADRLIELQYELSDRMSNFVWGIKPDHKQKNHYALQKPKDSGVGIDGRKRLQALSNPIFEELAMDVYDEIDRRETEALWQEARLGGNKPPAIEYTAVPFLTLHPEYSSTRNQGRQKLARFSQQELSVLVADILYDVVRRQSASGIVLNLNQTVNGLSCTPIEEDPIYDLPPDENQEQSVENAAARPACPAESVPLQEFLAVKKQLEEVQEEVSTLQEHNRVLSSKVTDLAKQNHELKKQKQFNNPVSAFTAPANIRFPANSRPSMRPTSVHDPNGPVGSPASLTPGDSHEQRRRTIHESFRGEIIPEKDPISQLSPSLEEPPMDTSGKKPTRLRAATNPHNSVGSDYDNNVAADASRKKGNSPATDGAADTTQGKTSPDTHNSNESNNVGSERSPSSDPSLSNAPHSSSDLKPTSNQSCEQSAGAKNLPKTEEVNRKIEVITKNIQNLYQTAQKGKTENYLNCSENILVGVKEIVSLFPENPADSGLAAVINKLGLSAKKLKTRCQNVSLDDTGLNTKQVTEEIIKNAYDVAKAAKELVTMTTKLQSANCSSSN